MMLMWRDRGLLPSLDANITTYLPEFKIVNPYQTQRGITFRQLASHMAGLPRESPCPNVYFDGCNATSKEIFERLAKLVLLSPPDTQPSYSNLGFALLGRTLERVFGGSWEVALEMFILSVLGMKNTGTAFTPEVLENLAVGYSSNGAVASEQFVHAAPYHYCHHTPCMCACGAELHTVRLRLYTPLCVTT